MGLEVFENNKTYLSIVQGKLRQKVNENTAGAEKREYETSDGGKGIKWELTYKAVNGFIKDIQFKESDFGEQFVLIVEDGGKLFQIQTPTTGRYFQDFAKKISNIHLDMDMRIAPYDFEADGKRKTGFKITQEGEKIKSWFYDPKTKKTVNGFPEPKGDGKGFDKDDWRMYFIEVKKFLKKHIEKVWAETPVPQTGAAADPVTGTVTEQDDF